MRLLLDRKFTQLTEAAKLIALEFANSTLNCRIRGESKIAANSSLRLSFHSSGAAAMLAPSLGQGQRWSSVLQQMLHKTIVIFSAFPHTPT